MRRHLMSLALLALLFPTAGAADEPAPSPATAPANSGPERPRRKGEAAIWIGLGATAIGCAVAIGSTMVASRSAKSAKPPRPAGDPLD